MKDHMTRLADAVVHLFKNCPTEAVDTQYYWLLLGTFWLLTLKKLSFLMSTFYFKKNATGQWQKCKLALRPLAYSTVADLVHYVRNRLKLRQISGIIYIFSRNIDDTKLPLGIQVTSVRLLLNLVDNIYHNTDSDRRKGWNLLVRILNTLINKFESLRHDIPLICNAELKRDNDAVKHAMKFHEKLISIAADKGRLNKRNV